MMYSNIGLSFRLTLPLSREWGRMRGDHVLYSSTDVIMNCIPVPVNSSTNVVMYRYCILVGTSLCNHGPHFIKDVIM